MSHFTERPSPFVIRSTWPVVAFWPKVEAIFRQTAVGQDGPCAACSGRWVVLHAEGFERGRHELAALERHLVAAQAMVGLAVHRLQCSGYLVRTRLIRVS